MYNHFFKHIDIQPENANILDGNAKDVKQECADFEKKIVEAGGIQLFVGGRVKWLKVRCYRIFQSAY